MIGKYILSPYMFMLIETLKINLAKVVQCFQPKAQIKFPDFSLSWGSFSLTNNGTLDVITSGFFSVKTVFCLP
jgi:hypothetical protein